MAFGITALITILLSRWWEEGNAERTELKKRIQLNKEVERITNVTRKKIKRNTPIENILPIIRIKDYEALAKAISTMDFIKDEDKGCLFIKMDPDFISKVLAYFSEAEEITILRQIERKKREEVLMRCSLYKRNRIESVLKKSEVSSQESNDSEGELNTEKRRYKLYLFDNKKKVDILLKLGIDQKKVERLVSKIETIPQEELEKKIASMITAGEDLSSDDLVTAYLILKHSGRASRNAASASQDHTKGE